MPEKIRSARSGQCAYCDRFCAKLTRDHIVPRSRGGTWNPSNIALVCLECNQNKADKPLEQWIESMTWDAQAYPLVQKWEHWKRKYDHVGCHRDAWCES